MEQINKDTTIGEILQKYPETAEIMLKHGLHCIGCAIATFETLEQGILVHGGSQEEVDSLIKELNEFIKKQQSSNNKKTTITKNT